MKYRIWDKGQECEREDIWQLQNENLVWYNDILMTTEIIKNDDLNFIVEFSTGLFDKNGKEIYENDRVYLSEIDKRGTLTIDVSVTMQLWFTSDDGSYHIDFGHFDTTNIEKIGTIHD